MEERLLGLLRLALEYGATDIHFVKRYSDVDISIRVNGSLKKIVSEPQDVRLLRYMQYLAGLDVAKLLYPQSAGFEMCVDGKLIPLRLSVFNSNELCDAVLRILHYEVGISIDNLSKEKRQNDYFKSLMENTSGLVLLSGPTGSGKTTTLYSLVRSLKGKKIYTIEDPVEIRYDELVQMSVNEELKLDYAEGVKQILRHDPDVILIGEIRDEKAAQMAVNAANTGHLVLSTIHASHAANCISRMEELGVRKDHLYEVLLCLSNQKLMYTRGGKKQVIYEIMDEEEIGFFKEHGENSKKFVSLKDRIARAKKEGYVETL